jgi:hypothetical protein
MARVTAWRIHHVAYVENLKPFAVVELLHRAHQPNVAFLYQVEERDAAAGVLLGYRDDKPEVGARQVSLRLAVTALDRLAR